MKVFLKKHYKKIVAVFCDLLCFLAALICAPLSESLLMQTDRACVWSLMGLQCITCGGTHFVNDLLAGRLGAAFADNQFLFVLTVYLAISLVFLNLYWLLDLAFAKKALKLMYNIPMLIVLCVGLFVFLFFRNMDAIANIFQAVCDLLFSAE